ncbi:MAG TPA: ABC transporter substrate-binding protein [Firmicutes bacterium]|nr:ABC transporter substrate-binding protein [Bacillota bacterium]
MILAPLGCSPGSQTEDVSNVGIVQIIRHEALDQAKEGFIKALEDEGFVEGTNLNISYKCAEGEQATARAIADGFVADEVDLILAIATPAAQAAAQATSDIPILITAVTSPLDAGLVYDLQEPGTNVSGTTDLNPVEKQLALIKEINPDAQTVGVIYNPGEPNSVYQVKLVKEEAPKLGLNIIEKAAPTGNDVLAAAEALVDVDAIYIPTDNTVVAAIDSVLKVAEAEKLIVITGEENSVKAGALATVAGIDYYQLGYQTGQMAAKILRGDAEPSTMPIESQDSYIDLVNITAAERLGLELPQSLLDRAELFSE